MCSWASHKVGTLSDKLERDSSGPFGGCARTAVCLGESHKVGTLADQLERDSSADLLESVPRQQCARGNRTR